MYDEFRKPDVGTIEDSAHGVHPLPLLAEVNSPYVRVQCQSRYSANRVQLGTVLIVYCALTSYSDAHLVLC